MIKIAQVQFNPWDKIYDFYILGQDKIEDGDMVFVRTELGTDIGRVISTREEKKDKYFLIEIDEAGNDVALETETSGAKMKLRPILRMASKEDINAMEQNNKNIDSVLDYCKRVVDRTSLPMKVVDARASYDGGRITFAFIADGRVDFRDLVKELTRHFQKTIRMQQLGARDEARVVGDYGHCGRRLCCGSYLKNLGGVTSELAANQQISHRGSDRLSGACGRLMCCLRYENEGYEELLKKLPAIGSKIKTEYGEGQVVGWHTLKQSVDVRVGDDDKRTIVEVEIKK